MAIALVTGGNSGIGSATVERLAHDGHDIVLHYRSNPERAQELALKVTALGRQCFLLQKDLADLSHLEVDFENFCIENKIRPTLLVNNAGMTMDGPFALAQLNGLEQMMATNLMAPMILSKWFLNSLPRKTEAAIVNIASLAGQMGNAGQVSYSASKAGLMGMTKALAREFGRRNIRINSIAAGIIETKMTSGISFLEALTEQIPLRRVGKPSEVSAVVSFLLSTEASYITGQTISVNGGLFCP